MSPPRPHIIAAKLPSGDQLTSARSTALADREKSATLFNETTRRSIEARLNGPPVHVTVGGVTLVDAIVMVLVAVFIGVLLATGGAL